MDVIVMNKHYMLAKIDLFPIRNLFFYILDYKLEILQFQKISLKTIL